MLYTPNKSTHSTVPRICMPTWRQFKKKAFHCGHYEAQDVLLECDDVDLIPLEPINGYEFREKWQRRLLYRDITKKLVFLNPGLRPVRLTRDYELFVAVCQTHHDVLSINAIENWKQRCKTSVIWLDELWAAMLPQYKYWIHFLNQFDHIFVGYSGTAGPLSQVQGRKCHWLSGGVDAIRFSPYPNPPVRNIDVYSIGRRWEKIHAALLPAAQRSEMFYIYDTSQGSFNDIFDHRQHRDLFANIAKRSKFFMVAPGKIDLNDETGGQVEVGFRYYEAAASGAVMIGQAPKCESYNEMFPWADAVVEIKNDGSDVLDVIAALEADPIRRETISRHNAVGALLRHDWMYRWKKLLNIAGLEPSPKMIERECRLKQLAEMASTEQQSRALVES